LTTPNGRNLGSLYRGWKIDQRDYTAIVLVNPPLNSAPLQLSPGIDQSQNAVFHLARPTATAAICVPFYGIVL
jgi:hypothetical protein